MALSTENIWEMFCCKLNAYIRRWIRDPQLANDIEQEVFLKIHKNINSLKDEKKVVGWVIRITKNTIMDCLRKSTYTLGSLDNTEIGIPDSEISIENLNERDLNQELTSGIKQIIEDLPYKYKQALIMVEFEGIAQKNLALELGISVSAAKSRVQRGRQMVKDILLNCCNYQFDKYGSVIGVKPKKCDE